MNTENLANLAISQLKNSSQNNVPHGTSPREYLDKAIELLENSEDYKTKNTQAKHYIAESIALIKRSKYYIYLVDQELMQETID